MILGLTGIGAGAPVYSISALNAHKQCDTPSDLSLPVKEMLDRFKVIDPDASIAFLQVIRPRIIEETVLDRVVEYHNKHLAESSAKTSDLPDEETGLDSVGIHSGELLYQISPANGTYHIEDMSSHSHVEIQSYNIYILRSMDDKWYLLSSDAQGKHLTCTLN